MGAINLQEWLILTTIGRKQSPKELIGRKLYAVCA